jgi:sarcosine oxidase delta subunit
MQHISCPYCGPTYPGEEARSAIDEVAREFGYDPKRLAGKVWRNKVGDPTGCIYCGKVYRSTVSTSFHASGAV